MKYLISIGHPAQFHLFKNIIKELHSLGHETMILSSHKDVLDDLLIRSDFKFKNILPRPKSSSLFYSTINLIQRCIIISKEIIKFKPNLLLGSEVTFPILGKIFRTPSIVFSEDDAKIIPQFVKLAYPFASVILSPEVCNAGKWEYKKVGYQGYQKLAYLHPKYFLPITGFQPKDVQSRYFLLRFAKLAAYHDKEKEGINSEVATKLIELLSPHGKIMISAERTLEPELEKYRLNINPLDIHSLLFYAYLYIGDSQSMAVESALLGTPNIRFNDFAGEIGVLEELEHKYNLTVGIKTSNANELFEIAAKYTTEENLKSKFKIRQEKMLSEKIDVVGFMVWFIVNYPDSHNTMKDNPDYQLKFK